MQQYAAIIVQRERKHQDSWWCHGGHIQIKLDVYDQAK